jgi:hypothetical protein
MLRSRVIPPSRCPSLIVAVSFSDMPSDCAMRMIARRAQMPGCEDLIGVVTTRAIGLGRQQPAAGIEAHGIRGEPADWANSEISVTGCTTA